MTESAHSINLDIARKLREDSEYRKKFFWAESSSLIAKQLIKLRKRRNKNQSEVAELVGTQQPAISRVERADYQNWSFSTLRKIADALNARVRVIIEPAEDVLVEYEKSAEAEKPSGSAKSKRAVSDDEEEPYGWNVEVPSPQEQMGTAYVS